MLDGRPVAVLIRPRNASTRAWCRPLLRSPARPVLLALSICELLRACAGTSLPTLPRDTQLYADENDLDTTSLISSFGTPASRSISGLPSSSRRRLLFLSTASPARSPPRLQLCPLLCRNQTAQLCPLVRRNQTGQSSHLLTISPVVAVLGDEHTHGASNTSRPNHPTMVAVC